MESSSNVSKRKLYLRSHQPKRRGKRYRREEKKRYKQHKSTPRNSAFPSIYLFFVFFFLKENLSLWNGIDFFKKNPSNPGWKSLRCCCIEIALCTHKYHRSLICWRSWNIKISFFLFVAQFFSKTIQKCSNKVATDETVVGFFSYGIKVT